MEGDSQDHSTPVEHPQQPQAVPQEEVKKDDTHQAQEDKGHTPVAEPAIVEETKVEIEVSASAVEITEKVTKHLEAHGIQHTQPQATEAQASEAPAPEEVVQIVEEHKAEAAEPEAEEEKHEEDSGSDSEIEGVCKSEHEAEKFLRVLEESKVEIFEALLENQKGYDSRYISYLREIKKLNQRFETKFQDVFQERKPSSSKIEKFWLTVLKNNPITASLIVPKDEPALEHLTDVSYNESKNGREITLKFEFSENSVFSNTELTKTYVLDSDDNLKKSFSSKIAWKGDDLTMKKIVETKKNKRSKAVKKVTKYVSDESFFNLFKEIEDFEDNSDVSEEDIAGMLGDDLEIGFEIRDEVVPYAFLWFLGVRTHGDDSDDEEEPKEGVAKASASVTAAGEQPADCKQQ